VLEIKNLPVLNLDFDAESDFVVS